VFAKIRLSNFSEIGFPEMAGALAHEIKNPAAVALAHVNLMRQETAPESPAKAHLNHIEQAIMDICDLVQEMLFAIYNCAEPYEIDLREMLDEMLDTYRAAWPGISFSLDADTSLTCYAQESSVRMVLSNLLKNAVEAVEELEFGQIDISARRGEEFLSIAIYNNGAFIDAAKPHGNGLGIAICRHILQQLGGHLEILGQPHEGCSSLVSIPL